MININVNSSFWTMENINIFLIKRKLNLTSAENLYLDKILWDSFRPWKFTPSKENFATFIEYSIS